MSNYVLIDSRGPLEAADNDYLLALAESLASAGHSVTLLLTQNGVLAARRTCPAAQHLGRLQALGVTVKADEFAVQERAIRSLADGVVSIGIDAFVGKIMDAPTRVLWH